MRIETPQPVGSARDQAAYWTVLLHTTENMGTVLPEFQKWLEAAPAHRPEFTRVEAVWRALDDLRDRGLLGEDTHSPIPSTQPLKRAAIAKGSWKRPVRVAALLGAIVLSIVGFQRLAHEGALQVRWCPPAPSRGDASHCWTAGLLSLNGQTLAQVAQQFNHYNRRKLLPDADITQVPIAGLYAATDPDEFATSLQRMLGIEHTVSRDSKTGEEVIHLHGRKPRNR
jgi:ferric-dicitrate binding protein FerR (iron transport regulator)